MDTAATHEYLVLLDRLMEIEEQKSSGEKKVMRLYTRMTFWGIVETAGMQNVGDLW